MSQAYYNEIDPFAAAWLRELIKMGMIAPGDVDERDIREVQPEDLRGYTQVHCFAGVGIWSYALRLAGWSDATPVWSGSAPCQPWSAAGKGAGFADERHLWPSWFRLIRECRPQCVFGEQVASPAALRWFDVVQDDLEGAGYAVGSADICAAGCGAPHIRQRLHFVAQNFVAHSQRRPTDRQRQSLGGAASGVQRPARQQRLWSDAGDGLQPDLLADAERLGSGSGRTSGAGGWNSVEPDRHSPVGGVEHPEDERCAGSSTGRWEAGSGAEHASWMGNSCVSGLARRSRQSRDDGPQQSALERTSGPTGGFWADAEWRYCRDGKWRPVEPGVAPLVDGPSARVGHRGDPGEPIHAEASAEARSNRLRGYGNAIVASLAAEFIRAYLETREQP